VKLLESRRIIMGYKGWAPSANGYPPFSNFAKQVLEKKGQEEFEKIFGLYFVSGKTVGAFLNIEMTSSCEDESSKSEMSAELEVTYNNACASASAKVGRTEKSESSSGSENLEVEITAIGHEIGSKITADNLGEAIKLHRNFAMMANGTGLSLLLQPYTIHPDY